MTDISSFQYLLYKKGQSIVKLDEVGKKYYQQTWLSKHDEVEEDYLDWMSSS